MPRRSRKRSKREASPEMELSKAISMAVRSGKVQLGANSAIDNSKAGKGLAFVVAQNAPEHQVANLRYNLKFYPNIKLINYPGSGTELGSMIGRPHRVSIMTIFEAGDSKILELDATPQEA